MYSMRFSNKNAQVEIFLCISAKMIIILTAIQIICKISTVNSNSSGRIIGGQQCSVEDNPFAVSLRTTTKLTHFCGGSLIKPQWVLTAAHCTFEYVKEPEHLTCIVGLSEYHRSRVQSIAADRIHIHEYYTFPAVFHDISLVHLVRPAILFSNVGLIAMPRKLQESVGCSVGKITGWGSMRAWDPDKDAKPKSQVSTHLMCVEVDLLSTEDCIAVSKGEANELVLCTRIGNQSKDACQGDSGGALFCGGTQIGIISAGKGCGVFQNIAYYTNVMRYVDYIERIVSGSEHRNNPFLIICLQIVFHRWIMEGG